MRNFVITVNGKSYEVAVEEVGAVASAPVQPVSMPARAARRCTRTRTRSRACGAQGGTCQRRKSAGSLPRAHQRIARGGGRIGQKGPARTRSRSHEDGQRHHRALRRYGFFLRGQGRQRRIGRRSLRDLLSGKEKHP